MRIYVETVIRADLDEVWRHTKDPVRHARWDLRFARIDHTSASRFRYRTTVLPFVHIDGFGSTSEQLFDRGAVSVLRFGSDDRRSLIARGGGYWRYVPVPGGVRFLTAYSYRPRWGASGRLADRLFRPVFGWATAWSFDRLRLWLEDGVSPATSRWCWLLETAARISLVIAARWFGPWLLLLAFGLPPSRWTPAARRCLRSPATPRRSSSTTACRTPHTATRPAASMASSYVAASRRACSAALRRAGLERAGV